MPIQYPSSTLVESSHPRTIAHTDERRPSAIAAERILQNVRVEKLTARYIPTLLVSRSETYSGRECRASVAHVTLKASHT
jgi:hypothetical protein